MRTSEGTTVAAGVLTRKRVEAERQRQEQDSLCPECTSLRCHLGPCRGCVDYARGDIGCCSTWVSYSEAVWMGNLVVGVGVGTSVLF